MCIWSCSGLRTGLRISELWELRMSACPIAVRVQLETIVSPSVEKRSLSPADDQSNGSLFLL